MPSHFDVDIAKSLFELHDELLGSLSPLVDAVRFLLGLLNDLLKAFGLTQEALLLLLSQEQFLLSTSDLVFELSQAVLEKSVLGPEICHLHCRHVVVFRLENSLGVVLHLDVHNSRHQLLVFQPQRIDRLLTHA